MFNIIEMLHIPNDVRGEKYLACSRSIFFTYIDTLSEYLAEEPTVEILEEFLSTFPHLIQTTFVDKWDELVWAAPFRNIPTSE